MWQMIMNPLDIEGHTCAMVDSCPAHLSEEEVYDMLINNFNRHYKTNRAPFGLYFHTIWFKEKRNFRALLKFLDELQKKPVSHVTRVLEFCLTCASLRTPTW